MNDPSIVRIAEFALKAGIPVQGWRIGTEVRNGAFAAVTLLRALRYLGERQLPHGKEATALEDARRAAEEFLRAAGAIE